MNYKEELEIIEKQVETQKIEKVKLDTMLYLKGKHLAEGLRRLGDKYDICMITATQTDKSVWGGIRH